MLKLVTEQLLENERVMEIEAEIAANEAANAHDDDLPPPIPNEAKLSWLSGLATVKADMPEERKNIHQKSSDAINRFQEKREVNAWSGLPQNTRVGDFRISPNTPQTAPSVDPVDRMIDSFRNRRPNISHNPDYRFITARFNSSCTGCDSAITRGDSILWFPRRKTVYCSNCPEFQDREAGR